MCLVTFTDLPCRFISSADTLDETLRESPCCISGFLGAFSLNMRLQTSKTTLNTLHTFIRKYVLCQFHCTVHVDMQHTLV